MPEQKSWNQACCGSTNFHITGDTLSGLNLQKNCFTLCQSSVNLKNLSALGTAVPQERCLGLCAHVLAALTHWQAGAVEGRRIKGGIESKISTLCCKICVSQVVLEERGTQEKPSLSLQKMTNLCYGGKLQTWYGKNAFHLNLRKLYRWSHSVSFKPFMPFCFFLTLFQTRLYVFISCFLKNHNKPKPTRQAALRDWHFHSRCSSLVRALPAGADLSPPLLCSIASVIQRAGCPVPDYIKHLPKLQRCVRLNTLPICSPFLKLAWVVLGA